MGQTRGENHHFGPLHLLSKTQVLQGTLLRLAGDVPWVTMQPSRWVSGWGTVSFLGGEGVHAGGGAPVPFSILQLFTMNGTLGTLQGVSPKGLQHGVTECRVWKSLCGPRVQARHEERVVPLQLPAPSWPHTPDLLTALVTILTHGQGDGVSCLMVGAQGVRAPEGHNPK